jgi:hypothetical protein
MTILNEEDLLRFPAIMASLVLPPRERKIVMLHANGFTFEAIASMEKVSTARIGKLHKRALNRIRKQVLELLAKQEERSLKLPTPHQTIYIGGNGVSGVGDRVLGGVIAPSC